MAEVKVTRTYLQMTAPPFLPTDSGDRFDEVRIDEVKNCPLSFFRYLYREVGRNYHWTDRLGWTDERIRSYLAAPGLSLWVMYVEGAPAGYFELSSDGENSTEIAYFGLLPEYHGRGLGKYLLNAAISHAWIGGAKRVWLHTCTLDDPAALPNYIKRGFTPFKEEVYFATVDIE